MQVGHMLEAIKAYQAELGYNYQYKTEEERMEHIRQLSLALNIEVTEFIDWLPWKPWRKIADQEMNRREAAFELIDIFFFMANLWSAIDMPTEDFEEYFKIKLAENLSRIERGYNKTAETSKQQELDL